MEIVSTRFNLDTSKRVFDSETPAPRIWDLDRMRPQHGHNDRGSAQRRQVLVQLGCLGRCGWQIWVPSYPHASTNGYLWFVPNEEFVGSSPVWFLSAKASHHLTLEIELPSRVREVDTAKTIHKIFPFQQQCTMMIRLICP